MNKQDRNCWTYNIIMITVSCRPYIESGAPKLDEKQPHIKFVHKMESWFSGFVPILLNIKIHFYTANKLTIIVHLASISTHTYSPVKHLCSFTV